MTPEQFNTQADFEKMENDLNAGSVKREMPKYQSHKIVHALKIKSAEYYSETPTDETDGTMILTFEEEGYAPMRVPFSYVSKHNPKAGGYYVIYEDGYASWSPAKAFEEGYTKIK
jgi:hypothetical protein